MNNTVYVALGSNLGDREKNIENAVEKIGKLEGTGVIKCSSLYETEPVGYLDQGRFLNAAAMVMTMLSPLQLLAKLQEIEKELGRTRDIHWGPRTVDIDILLYEDLKMDLPELIIPHPRMTQRGFVLIPLEEIYEARVLMGKDIIKLIESCDDKNGVKLYRGKVSE